MWSLSLVDLVFYFVSYALCVRCLFFLCYFSSHNTSTTCTWLNTLCKCRSHGLIMCDSDMSGPCCNKYTHHYDKCMISCSSDGSAHVMYAQWLAMNTYWVHVAPLAYRSTCIWSLQSGIYIFIYIMFSHQCFTCAFSTCEALTILHCHTTMTHIVHMVVLYCTLLQYNVLVTL